MSDIRDWYTVAASNSAPSPDGMPEGMQRSGVNDAGREEMASIKVFFNDGSMKRAFEDFSLLRTSGTSWIFQDGSVETNAAQWLEVGQRIRMQGGTGADAGKAWEGFVESVGTYSAPNSAFTVSWLASESADTAGPATATCYVEVGMKELGRAAWADTGTASGQVPTNDDLDPHVLKAESALDVGLVGGRSASDLVLSGAYGRMNWNGCFGIWQRALAFTGASDFDNSDLNLSADNWVILSDGADRVDISRENTPANLPIGFQCAAKLVSNGTQLYGLMTIIDAADAYHVTHPNSDTHDPVSLSIYLREDPANTGINSARVYMLKQITSPAVDPVGTWNAAGADFTPSAGWQIIRSDVVNFTTSWAEYTVFENQLLDTPGTGNGNIAIVVVPDDTPALNATWWVTGVQLNHGPTVVPFISIPRAYEWLRAQRHCCSTFDEGAIDDEAGDDEALVAVGASPRVAFDWRFPVPMYAQPTVVAYNPRVGGAAGQVTDGAADIGAPTVSVRSTRGAWLYRDSGASTGSLYRVAAYAYANILGNN